MWDFPTVGRRCVTLSKKSSTTTLDAKGRLLIPEAIRSDLHLQPGDVFFIDRDSETGTIQLAKAINPFDVLARKALDEYQRGITLSIEDAWKLAESDDD
jgi:AbrB family looped-hinge helix DNA binding protein